MIVRDEDAFECFPSGLDELFVLVGVEERIDEEAVIPRLDVVAVDGETSGEHLLDIVPWSLIDRFHEVLVVCRLARHKTSQRSGERRSLIAVFGEDGLGHAHGESAATQQVGNLS